MIKKFYKACFVTNRQIGVTNGYSFVMIEIMCRRNSLSSILTMVFESLILPKKHYFNPQIQIQFMLRFLVLISFLLCLFWAKAQQTLPPYKHYTMRDGLSQMQVITMFQDSRGYIWVGTKSGLNCFNGENFETYTSKKFPEIVNDHIKQICEDSNGRIWASTNAGILCVDGFDLKFFKIDDNLNTVIVTDDKGRVWFSKLQNSDFEVSIFYIEADSIKPLSVDFPENKVIPYVELKYVKEEDALLLALNNRLYFVKNGKSEIIHQNNNFIHFFPEIDKVLFSESVQKNIDVEDIYNFNLKKYEKGKIKDLAQIREGKIVDNIDFHDTLPYVCVSLPHSNYLITPFEINYNAFEGINSNYILLDRDGRFWVGSEDGLYKPFGNAFSAYKQEFLPQIWAAIEDKDGAMWFSSYLYGLYKKDSDKIEHFPSSFKNRVADFYFHPSIDKRGRLFFPNAFGILMVDGTLFKQYAEHLYLTTYYDKERNLIWGGMKKGAVAFDSTRKKIRIIDEKSGLDVGNHILTIGKDTLGDYWFGGGTGLARYNWQKNILKNYKPGNRNTGVYTQRNDFTGRTWFGTKDGLYWYNTESDSLCKIKCEELSDAVNMLEPIDSSWLIVSQPYGIYLLDLQAFYKNAEIKLHLFNDKNGFLGIEPGQDGAFTDSKGYVWMTTSTELMKLDPRKINLGNHHLTVRVDKINGQKLPFSMQPFTLARNQNSVVITFDAICFNRPNPVQYCWKLSTDTVWSAWQEEDYSVVSNLPDGKSEIMLQARVPGLPGTMATTSIMVKIRLAIWKQPWFFPSLFGLFALLSMLVFLLFIRTRTQMMLAARQSKVFQVQAIQSQMNPHFIFNVLASFQSMILSLETEKANHFLVKLANLIRGFLDASSGSQIRQNKGESPQFQSLQKELELINGFVEFQQLIYPGKIEFVTEIDPDIDVENETIPPMILQPFVENSIRHGLLLKEGKGILLIRIKRRIDKGLHIMIEDDGVGIEKAGRVISDSPFRYESKGSFLTLNRIKLLNELGFQISVLTNSSDKGTKIEITIPYHE